MKLTSSVLAVLCAVGCETAAPAQPDSPLQPIETYDVGDPHVETTSLEIAPAVSPIASPRIVPVTVPPVDPCPLCGMG